MLCMQRYQHSFLTNAVLFVAALVVTERQCASQSNDRDDATKPAVKPVFPPPLGDELSKLERPELRLQLLKMVSDDQVARLAAT